MCIFFKFCFVFLLIKKFETRKKNLNSKKTFHVITRFVIFSINSSNKYSKRYITVRIRYGGFWNSMYVVVIFWMKWYQKILCKENQDLDIKMHIDKVVITRKVNSLFIWNWSLPSPIYLLADHFSLSFSLLWLNDSYDFYIYR